MSKGKGKISRRGALVATAMAVFATPAFASLMVQNYMEADITVADACFVKVGGQDTVTYTGDPLASFSADGTTDTIQVEGVDLLEEKLTIQGMIGDRVTYSDVVRYENNCDVPLDVRLSTSGTLAQGTWTGVSARIYISDSPVAIGSGIVPAGFPSEPGVGWDTTPIVVDNGGNISSTQTTSVTIPPGQMIYGGIIVSAGTNASAAQKGTINWIAQATNINS